MNTTNVLLEVLFRRSMLFDRRPKNKRSDMYGRDEEIGDLSNYIENETPGIIIRGHRRVGKTSILKTVLNESVKHYIYIDMRDLGSVKNISKQSIIARFQGSINEFLNKNRIGKEKLLDVLKNVSGVTIMGSGVQFGWQRGREVDLAQTFRELDNWAKDNKFTIVVAIDEAQILGQSKYYNVAGILASIYDNCRNLVVVLTGSAFKLLDKFMGLNDPKSDLYGRDFEVIHVSRLSKEQSIELLRSGFREISDSFENDPTFDRVVDEAASKLGGIIGWLVMFGAKCKTQGKISESDISAIQKMGAQMAGAEFETVFKHRKGAPRYRDIMVFVAESPRTWTRIKKMLMERSADISDSNVTFLLDALSKHGFLDRNEETKRYAVPDPLLEFFFR